MTSKSPAVKRMTLVSIVGVDGCGKSTALERLKVELAPFVCETCVMHLSNYKRTLPASGRANSLPPRPVLLCIAKIMVHALRWTWQYHTNVRKKCFQGGLVLLDRFYFDDLVINPRKYRYAGPTWILMAIRKLVPAPNLYILLDVAEETAVQRKQENSMAELIRQRQAFLNLIQTVNGFVVNANNPLDEVVNDTRSIILDFIHKQTLQPVS